QKIGVMFGNPETTTGGMALKFYASVRLDVRPIDAIKSGDEVVGNRTRVRVKKNKVAPPFRKAEFDIMHNQGISREGDILDLGVEMELIDKKGAFYSFEGTRMGQGRENAREFLKTNPEIMSRLDKIIREKAGLGAATVPAILEDKDRDKGDDEDDDDEEEEDKE
ncbi:MAG TPA: DNA recombination/repair protein RecA, partial [Anaerolineae bacterium]